MIDGTTLMIVGIVAQTVAPAQKMFVAIRPYLRGPGILASLAIAPPLHAVLPRDAIVITTGAPVTPDR